MAQKAQTYIDKSGNSWLVFYDKDGDAEWDTWTTNSLIVKPNRIYKNEELGLEIGIETCLFPNGMYGFGYISNCLEHNYKTQSCIASGRAFQTEIEAAQNALLELKYSKITFKFKDKVLELIQEIEKDLIPSTLF